MKLSRVAQCVSLAALFALTGAFSCRAAATPADEAAGSGASQLLSWEDSIVNIEVSRKQYDYYQPWTRRPGRALKTGIVIGEKEILTTADELFDRTLVRIQKGGTGLWIPAQVTWADYHANLALVTVPNPAFWRDLKPARLAASILGERAFQIMRWRNGNLEKRRAEFTQYTVREGQLSAVNQAVIEADSDIQGAGWSEAAVLDGHLAGLISAQDGRTCTILPITFIRPILEAVRKKEYRGLGYFHFVWQPGVNPASLESLGLKGQSRGVIVIEVPDRPDACEQVVKPNDVILRVDGFDIDTQGNYRDPECGSLMLECLATRGKWAGDTVNLQIWRSGKTMEVKYQLPKYDYGTSLVPFATFDQEPEYLIMGGLVFQPLTDPYLQSWGPDWRRRSPFRLYHYRGESPKKERSALVVLSQVLPDAYNIGYQEQKCLVVDKVNGQSISRLSELREAFQKPVNGFHIIELMKSDSLRRIVLAAGAGEQEATDRVLQRYGISKPFNVGKQATQ